MDRGFENVCGAAFAPHRTTHLLEATKEARRNQLTNRNEPR